MTDAVRTLDDAPSPENPFLEASAPIKKSWLLGFHDGFENLHARADERAFATFAKDYDKGMLDEAIVSLGQHKADLEAARFRIEKYKLEADAGRPSLIPAFGIHAIGWSARFMAFVYVLLAVASVIAEFPLSALTVAESIGNLTVQQMAFVKQYSIWALTAMLCLMGFALKLLVDVLDHGKGHRWWEKGVAIVDVALAGVSIYGVAMLRDAIAEQARAVVESKPLAEQLQTTAGVVWWSAFTFKWVTLTLPIFAAVCVVVALHQMRNYRKHNKAVRQIVGAEREWMAATQAAITLEQLIEADDARLVEARDGRSFTDDFVRRAAGAYENGVETGRRKRISRLSEKGVYEQVVEDMKRSLYDQEESLT